jgi:Flp pilus assembly protein TadD
VSCQLLLLAGCATTEGPNASTAKVEAERVAQRSAELVEHGESALAAGQLSEAQRLFSRVLGADPGHPRAKLGLAEVQLASGHPKEALSLFEEVQKEESLSAVALQGKGIALLLTGNAVSAHRALQDALRQDASLWRAWNALGQYFDGVRAWEDASRCYEKALALQPDAAIVFNNLGVSFVLRGRYPESANYFREALAHASGDQVIRGNLRIALAWQGRYVEALAGVTEDDAPTVLNDIGYVALLRGDHAISEGYLSRAMQESPSFFSKAWKNLRYLATLTAEPRQ